MSHYRSIRTARPYALVSAFALITAAGPALAQSAPEPKPAAKAPEKSDANTVEGVTVTAKTDGYKSSIDRRSYDLSKDLNGSTGTLADALRNVPSVSVDLNGNVSIRGNSGVTIMVDGKPSTLFQGGDAGQVLESLPADQFERVEVITTPTAAMSPDGSAGVINLVSKKVRKPGYSGSLRLSADPEGRANASLNANLRKGKLTLSLRGGLRHDFRDIAATDERKGFDLNGVPTFSSSTDTRQHGGREAQSVRLGAEYDVNPKLRVNGSVRYNNFTQDGRGTSSQETRDGSGVVTRLFDRDSRGEGSRTNTGADLGFRRTFAGAEHDLTGSLTVDHDEGDRFMASVNDQSFPAAPLNYDLSRGEDSRTTTALKLDYQRPMPREAKFKAGLELRDEAVELNTEGFLAAPSPNASNSPSRTNLFRFDRTIGAVYATYEQPIGDFTILPGLRLETSTVSIDQVTSHIQADQDDFKAYPSLHLGYTINDQQNVVLAYSTRVQRPDPASFNPFVTVNSPFDLSQGNPNLKPQNTQKLEARWEYKKGETNYSASLYQDRNDGGVTPVVTDLGGGVFLTTQQNLVKSRSTGLELNAGGKIGKSITYNLNANVYQVEIDASAPAHLQGRTGWSSNGYAQVSWQMTPNDLLQLNGNVFGGGVTSQGTTTAFKAVNLGYRHKFDSRFSAIVTVNDVFDTARFGSRIDTATLKQRSETNFGFQSVFFTLNYSFGATTKRDPAIAFDQPGT